MDADLVELMKVLANPTRLQIMEWLSDPDAAFADYEPIADRAKVGVCVTHLVAKSGLAPSTISTYMSALEHANLVTSTRIGKWTHYRRNGDEIDKLIRRLGAALAVVNPDAGDMG